MITKIFNPQVSYVELVILILGLAFAGVLILVCRPVSTFKMVREMFRPTSKQ